MAHASVCLGSSPPHTFVQRTIEWLTEFCHLAMADRDLVARLHIAVAELVENVVKYGMETSGKVDVTLENRGDEVYLRLETTNSAPPEDIRRVTALLGEIQRSDDPLAYYDRLIMQVAPYREQGVSGLGLARIRAEGELNLDYQVDGNVLRLVVETPIGKTEVS